MIKEKTITPIFIFSLPRAGSTLLQRIMGADKAVSYTSEPWVLLPFFYALKTKGVRAEYNHQVMTRGTRNFTEVIDSNNGSYQHELAEFTTRLYRKAASDNAKYFIDKTPRYHYIVDEILETFTDAKFIFLWRNPLAIKASCIETWCSGKWNTHLFTQDQHQGLKSLISAYEKNKQRSWALNYEDLVSSPEETLKPLFEDYLNIEFNPEIIKNFSKNPLKKGLGDTVGSQKYSTVSNDSLFKWQQTMSGILRKQSCQKYLQWIGDEDLASMGYNRSKLSKEVQLIPTSYSTLGPDLLRAIYGKAYSKLKHYILNTSL